MFVLTNNPMVLEAHAADYEVVFERVGYVGILEEAARYIADGHRLLTHPLSGSAKPKETPYKSMLLSSSGSPVIDRASASLISNAILACGTFADRSYAYTEQTLHDLQMVDLSLIEGALQSV